MAAKNPVRKVTLDLCPPERIEESITLKINMDKYLVDILKRINTDKPTRNRNWTFVTAVLLTESIREAMIDYSTKNFKGNTNLDSGVLH